MAAANALGLDILEFFAVPDHNDTSNLNQTYNRFRQVVDGYTVRVHIRNSAAGAGSLHCLKERPPLHVQPLRPGR